MVTRSEASRQLTAVVIPAPESNKKRKLTSFAELDEALPSSSAPIVSTSSNADQEEDEDDDDDDDEAPEEETNVKAKKGAKRREAEIKELDTDAAQKRKRAAEAAHRKADAKKSREKAKAERVAAKEEQRLAALAAQDAEAASLEQDKEVDEEGADLDADAMSSNEQLQEGMEDAVPQPLAPPKSNKLDPALFAAAFAAKGDGKARGILDSSAAPKGILRKSKAPSAKELHEARKAEKRTAIKEGKRLARGKDGEAIRRLKDGRTVVRALGNASTATTANEGEESETLVLPPPPPPLDASQSLPPARARAFKKRALGHKSRPSSTLSIASTVKGKARKAYDPDDPLGLNDPAFATGGEFAHIRLDRKPQRDVQRAKAKTAAAGRRKGENLGWKGEGGRIEARKLAMPIGGSGARPAAGFARSRLG